MEHCYRIALWMFCFIVYLQAMPTPQCIPTEDDLSLDDLKKVSCENMTFLSQPNERDSSVAIKCIIYELKRASVGCTDEKKHTNFTLGSLEDTEDPEKCPQFATSSSDCPWTTRKNFTVFVDDVEAFFYKLRQSKNK